MFRLIKLLLIWSVVSPVTHAIEPSSVLLEASPSAGLAGDLEMRGEFFLKRDWRLATQIGYSTYQSAQISKGTDIWVDSSAQYYPDVFNQHGPYFGIGIQVRNQAQDFQRARPRRTYFQPTSSNDMDRWTVDSMSVSLTQTLGYRLMLGEMLTTSMGIEAAENLHSAARIKDQQLIAGSEVSLGKSPALQTRVMMNVGFMIP